MPLLQAVSFVVACLTLLGVGPWLMYTATGLAALPVCLKWERL